MLCVLLSILLSVSSPLHRPFHLPSYGLLCWPLFFSEAVGGDAVWDPPKGSVISLFLGPSFFAFQTCTPPGLLAGPLLSSSPRGPRALAL